MRGDDAMNDFRAAIRAEFPDGAPRVLDPFAGGGAIPLEAMRLGCRVTASDLNPVAWFILKCTLDYPQRFAGKEMAAAGVRAPVAGLRRGLSRAAR